MNPKLKFLAIVLFGLFLFSPSLMANCDKACEKFIICTEEINKRTATPEEKTKLNKACADSCKKYQTDILGCFEKSNAEGGSCASYSACTMQVAQKLKNNKKK